nr:hypothetical protein [Tanacetum cinerariifolium]
METNDQEIQTILMGLLKDIYYVVDSCDIAQEIWLRIEQMMKGLSIEAHENKAKNKHFPEKIASNLKFLNKLQPEWECRESEARAKGNGNGNNGDVDRIQEVNANCILMANLQQASTSVEQYTKVLDLITEPHQDQQNDRNVISMNSSVKHSGGIVEQQPATVEETRAFLKSLYNNLVIEVEKVNMVNCKIKDANTDLTIELARYKGQ